MCDGAVAAAGEGRGELSLFSVFEHLGEGGAEPLADFRLVLLVCHAYHIIRNTRGAHAENIVR